MGKVQKFQVKQTKLTFGDFSVNHDGTVVPDPVLGPGVDRDELVGVADPRLRRHDHDGLPGLGDGVGAPVHLVPPPLATKAWLQEKNMVIKGRRQHFRLNI